ncbi:hypothetical protein [Pseudoruegeria sp. SK021]|uniref:hypothetical protein n=1 Tax=Pseudoruegeria sp. SK021 TaxID=1933035 RepID=UPI00197EBD1D|nr:hypothetical protein [Pseudoruegeria sp. SK021]
MMLSLRSPQPVRNRIGPLFGHSMCRIAMGRVGGVQDGFDGILPWAVAGSERVIVPERVAVPAAMQGGTRE